MIIMDSKKENDTGNEYGDGDVENGMDMEMIIFWSGH